MKYKFDKNTFVQVAREDKQDFLEAEVGDIKQPDFHPQVKIKRWDNECNLSVRFKHEEKGIEKVEMVGEKIVWKKGSTEAHFYDIENGYEFEIIYHKKPKTNVTEFTIQTKGLDFWYQDELTEDQVARGCRRPENVIGSYAVYMERLKKTYHGKTQYKTGKVGHIYRPKVTDASGKEIWGILNVDKEKGILSVTVPQEFLDKAKYPVVVDPTFGYDTAGSSDLDVGNAINAFCSLLSVVAVTGDVLTGYSFYARKLAANETVAINSYVISGGVPTTKISGTDQSINVNSSTPQWWSVGSLSISMTNGVEYGVAYGGWGGTAPDENTQIYFDSSSGSNISYNSATSLSTNWNETNTYSDLLSLYATFTRQPIDINYSFNIFIDKGKL